MAYSPGNDKVRAEDRARALLALAAQADEPQGPCLSALEMAGLVEGKVCAGRDLKALRAHLAGCQHCYTEWLLLHNMARNSAPRGRLYQLRRWAGWPYLGTALAAAASLAVYLNVIKMEDTVLPRAVPPVVFQQDKEHEAPHALQPQREAEQAPVPPAALSPRGEADAVQGVMAQRQAVPLARSEQPEAERQKQNASQSLPAAPMQAEKKFSRQALPPPAEMSAAPAGPPAEANLRNWLLEVHSGCLAGRREPHFWSRLTERGQSLLVDTPLDEEGAKVEPVLTLLQSINGPDTVAEQCHLIQAELAKGGKGR